MSRSIKQQTKRRFKRQQRPTFAFTRLPAELQFMVLCKCDPQTAESLVKASSYVRGLYIRYSETAFVAILAQNAAPVEVLCHVSWCLNSLQNDGSDHALVAELLEMHDIFEWPSKLPAPRLPTSDPLEALRVLLDFHLEVHDAADLFGQCMVVGVDKFLDPTVHTLPIALSAAEHARIACTLWVLKIFHQIGWKLNNPPHLHTSHTANAFVENLKPWQVDQILSLEMNIGRAEYPIDDTLCFAGLTDAGLLARLMDTQYVKNLSYELYGGPRRPLGYVHRIPSDAVHSLYRTRDWTPAPVDTDILPKPASIAMQLQTRAWISTESALQASLIARTRRYRNCSRYLGLVFWDWNRLVDWQIAHVDELMAASDYAHFRGLSIDPIELHSEHLDANARTLERQILEWTRSPSNDTLEDWLYRRTIDFRYKQRMDPFPRRFITPGATCDDCGWSLAY